MQYINNKATDVKIAYIGGGSKGWAWGLMSDLVSCEDMSGQVYLYDIDHEAARTNAVIGNRFNTCEGANTHWDYTAVPTIGEALTGANFVVISILPGTFDEMESDVHLPEKYGIYQSVGDSSGPGGIVRAMRCMPMFEEIALNIKKYCPDAWVINYTNPMTLCTAALYRTFPEIKAFGCCHEVFGTQNLLMSALKEMRGITVADRHEIRVNPVGVNHFTWLTKANYHDIDLFPVYKEFAEKYQAEGYSLRDTSHWMNDHFACSQQVKFDLFRRYGQIAAAGDRHLAEFVPGNWYLQSGTHCQTWGFNLTPVSWRKERAQERIEKGDRLCSGEQAVELKKTGEEGVMQMRAILGLGEPLVTNVNLPNIGQIPNLPMGAVVETNAVFRAGTVTPVMAGPLPQEIYPLISRICGEQQMVGEAIKNRDIKTIFAAFVNDPLVRCTREEAKELFIQMVENTKAYLGDYDLSQLKELD